MRGDRQRLRVDAGFLQLRQGRTDLARIARDDYIPRSVHRSDGNARPGAQKRGNRRLVRKNCRHFAARRQFLHQPPASRHQR